MIFITVVYFITYISNDKYEIEYKALLKNGRKDLVDLLKEEGDIYNPLMDLTIKFSGFQEELSERYLLKDRYTEELIKGNFSEGENIYRVKKNILYFDFDIVFLCEDPDCYDEITTERGYTFSINAQGYKINDQDKIPIQMVNEERNMFYDYNIFNPYTYLCDYNPIIFRESFGGFSNLFNPNEKNVYSIGEYELVKQEDIFNDIYQYDENITIKYLISFELGGIGTVAEFKRTKKELLDVVAKICFFYPSEVFTILGLLLKPYF